MKRITILIFTSLLVILSGCGSATKITTSQNPKNLVGKKIHLQLVTSSGAISVSLGAMTSSSSVIAEGNAMSGEKQAEIAAQNLAFELRSLGLKLTNSSEDSEVVANFSIGTIRYDPIAGWIADQAFLEFYDSSGQHILTVRAQAKFITPTVKNIINNLVNELEKNL